MALKITCPHCSTPRRLSQPYPLPGAEVHCHHCGRTLAISYPQGMVERMKAKGVVFIEQGSIPDPGRITEQLPDPRGSTEPTVPDQRGGAIGVARTPRSARDERPTSADGPGGISPGQSLGPNTPRGRGPGQMSPQRGRPGAVPPVDPSAGPIDPTVPMGTPRGGHGRRIDRDPPSTEPTSPKPVPRPRTQAPKLAAKAPTSGRRIQSANNPGAPPPPRKRRGWFARIVLAVMLLGLLGGLGGGGVVAWAFWTYSQDLPTVETLGNYEPPTVSVVYDTKGRRLGEIYEKRRYVTDLEKIPKHVQNAFIAAEDANFWTHGGVDYEGILRAIGRNLSKGRKAQGASTITMQVTRNFLLTRDKTYKRKIREVLLSWRLEEAFTKSHILYLYLNEIYLGSGAYGVEAAARTYFDKHVEDLTLGEAAILAGLPQRPSDYSPHRHWDKARARQEYVLGQMKAKGYINEAQHREALATPIDIIQHDNEFLSAAPYFTEHIRRYLVDTYGFDKIYNDGLNVDATCDLDLQRTAQKAVVDGVTVADQRVGWRGPLETLAAEDIQGRLDAQEQTLREEVGHATLRVGSEGQGGGYGALPTRSALEVGRRYEAVTLEVEKKHAIVGIGAHRVLVPTSWTSWAYEPNPKRSWRSRRQDNMTNVLKRGDVVLVDLEGLDSQTFDNLKGYGPAKGLPAARLRQNPELQGALFSYRLEDGAVLSMVGGVDFENSEYNRATQARRQVGSTFKPIVYAAAISTRQLTAGSIVQDAPLVFQTLGDKLWKPGNYSQDYLGNITLRRALQLSKNVCTVRVLDKIGLEPVFDFAGPKLRIGYNEPQCSRTHDVAGSTCKGDISPSNVKGMQWCEYCEPTSCPLVLADAQEIPKDGYVETVGGDVECLDEPTTIDGKRWCHSCEVNLRVCDWLPLESIPAKDPCVDARRDDNGKTWCRTCDLSMGLGSSSLTMVELARAYSAFATYGKLVEPHWINRVVDRDGTVIESWTMPEGGWKQVLDPGVAGIAHWLVREVATGGTGAATNRLGIQVAGKTGTTNDFFDAWFVGYDPEVLTAAWVGFDQPRSMGQSFTGGKTALPIWMDFMKVAAPKSENRRFKPLPGSSMVSIDELTGRVAIGGRSIPMLPGTAPTNVVGAIGQKSADDLLVDDF